MMDERQQAAMDTIARATAALEAQRRDMRRTDAIRTIKDNAVDDIAETIISVMSPARADELARVILDRLSERT
jgi:hypothetical protein